VIRHSEAENEVERHGKRGGGESKTEGKRDTKGNGRPKETLIRGGGYAKEKDEAYMLDVNKCS